MQRVGKYEILRKLGEGATSTVWLGHDHFARRDVAVKVIAPEVLKDPERGRAHRQLLLNEASLAGRLLHPHIVQILDASIEEDLAYIVMEYVAGGTLEEFCRPDNLLPLERVTEIAFKCARALDFAARMGITHRDIKPANILLAAGSSSDIKISDFGAALRTDGEPTRTQVTGVGSPAYMSPQQLREEPLDSRTDIYSLGVAMYKLLTGRLPFQAGSNYAMIYQVCNVVPPPPSALRADIPASLDAIVVKAMRKELDARYANWGAFADDLAAAFRSRRTASPRYAFPDSDKFATLRALPFFDEFSDVEIWEAVRLSRWDTVGPDTPVMKDGEPGDFFCFLIEGELEVAKHGRPLETLRPGDCFGEMAILGRQGGARAADVVARSPAQLVTIRGEALNRASESCRMHFHRAFLDVLTARLAQANIRLTTM